MPKKEAVPAHPLPVSKLATAPSSAVTEQDLLQRAATALQRVQTPLGATVRPQDVLVLQRTLGNRAVQRLLAPTPVSSTPVIQRGRKKIKQEEAQKKEGQIQKPRTQQEQKKKIKKEAKRTDTTVANAIVADGGQVTPKSNNPIDRLRRSALRNKDKKATPKKPRNLHEAQQKHSYGYDHPKIDTGLVKGSFSKGYGGQPNFIMNSNDYDGAVVKNDYDAIVAVIQEETRQKDAPREAEIAMDLMAYIDTGRFDKEKYSPQMCRAAATLISLTQFMESHETRELSADKWARACLRAIAGGTSTFKTEFNRKTGNYIPARATKAGAKAGGQEATRLALGKERKESDKATKEQVLHDGWDASLAFLSESSEEEGMVEEPKETKSDGGDVAEQPIETEVPTWNDGSYYHSEGQEQSIEIVGYDGYGYGNESQEQPIETESEGQTVNNAWHHTKNINFDGDDF